MSAAKEKRRPPLTTLATLLTLMVRSSYCWSGIDSELQSGLAGRVGDGGHTAVVTKTASVEHDARDARRLGPLGNQAADGGGSRLVGGGGETRTEVLLDRRCRRQRAAGPVVDDLGDDVTVGPEHGQAGPRLGTDHLLADPVVAPGPPNLLVLGARGHVPVPLLGGLAGFALDELAGITDSLALVGLGLADLADVGGDLPDLLLVDPHHADAGGGGDLERDPCWCVDDHRVAEAEGQLDLAGRPGDGTVADADDLEVLPEPGGHPEHHVVDEAAGETVQGAVLPLVVRSLDQQDRGFLADGDGAGEVALERALRPFHADVTVGEGDLHARRDGNG